MDERDLDVPADECFLLGLVSGLCNQEPRDQGCLDVVLAQLRLAQDRARRAAGARPPGPGTAASV